jgi:hypothetical protein
MAMVPAEIGVLSGGDYVSIFLDTCFELIRFRGSESAILL